MCEESTRKKILTYKKFGVKNVPEKWSYNRICDAKEQPKKL